MPKRNQKEAGLQDNNANKKAKKDPADAKEQKESQEQQAQAQAQAQNYDQDELMQEEPKENKKQAEKKAGKDQISNDVLLLLKDFNYNNYRRILIDMLPKIKSAEQCLEMLNTLEAEAREHIKSSKQQRAKDKEYLRALEFAFFGKDRTIFDKKYSVLKSLILANKWEILGAFLEHWCTTVEESEFYYKFRSIPNLHLRVLNAILLSDLGVTVAKKFIAKFSVNINSKPFSFLPKQGFDKIIHPKLITQIFDIFDEDLKEKMDLLLSMGATIDKDDLFEIISRWNAQLSENIYNYEKIAELDKIARAIFKKLIQQPAIQQDTKGLDEFIRTEGIQGRIVKLLQEAKLLETLWTPVDYAIDAIRYFRFSEFRQAYEAIEKENAENLKLIKINVIQNGNEGRRYSAVIEPSNPLEWMLYHGSQAKEVIQFMNFFIEKQPHLITELPADVIDNFIYALTKIASSQFSKEFTTGIANVLAKLSQQKKDLCEAIVCRDLVRLVYSCKEPLQIALLKGIKAIAKPEIMNTITTEMISILHSGVWIKAYKYRQRKKFEQSEYLESLQTTFELLKRIVDPMIILKSFIQDYISNSTTSDPAKLTAVLEKFFNDSNVKNKLNRDQLHEALHDWCTRFTAYDGIHLQVIDLFLKLGADINALVENNSLLFSLVRGCERRCESQQLRIDNEGSERAVLQHLLNKGANPLLTMTIANETYNFFEYLAVCILQNAPPKPIYEMYERMFLENNKFADEMRKARDNMQKKLVRQGMFQIAPLHTDKQSVHRVAVHRTVSKSAEKLVTHYLPKDAAERKKTVEMALSQIETHLKNNLFKRLKEEAFKNFVEANPGFSQELLYLMPFAFTNNNFITNHIKNASYWLWNEYIAYRWFTVVRTHPINNRWRDELSKLSINELLASVWLAIHDTNYIKLEDGSRESNLAALQLMLAQVQREYNTEPDVSKDQPSCPAGAFNIITSILDQVHPFVSIKQISADKIFNFIRDFYETCFSKLPPKEKNEIYAKSLEENELPTEFIQKYRDAFFDFIKDDIAEGYIRKDLVEACYSVPFPLDSFKDIKDYVPVIILEPLPSANPFSNVSGQGSAALALGDDDVVMDDNNSGNDSENSDPSDSDTSDKADKPEKSGKDAKESEEVEHQGNNANNAANANRGATGAANLGLAPMDLSEGNGQDPRYTAEMLTQYRLQRTRPATPPPGNHNAADVPENGNAPTLQPATRYYYNPANMDRDDGKYPDEQGPARRSGSSSSSSSSSSSKR